MEKVLSNLDYVKELDGHIRDIVIDAYVHSVEYTHCEYLHTLLNRSSSVYAPKSDLQISRYILRLLRAGSLDGSLDETARS